MADEKKNEDKKTEGRVRTHGVPPVRPRRGFTHGEPQVERKVRPVEVEEFLAGADPEQLKKDRLVGALHDDVKDEIAAELLRQRQLGWTSGNGPVPDVVTHLAAGVEAQRAAHEPQAKVEQLTSTELVESADVVIPSQVHDGYLTDNEMAKIDASRAVQPLNQDIKPIVPPGDIPKDEDGKPIVTEDSSTVAPIEAEKAVVERSQDMEVKTEAELVIINQDITSEAVVPEDATDPGDRTPEPERQKEEGETFTEDVTPVPEVPEVTHVEEQELPEVEEVEPPVVDEVVPATDDGTASTSGGGSGQPVKSKAQAIKDAVEARKQKK